MSADPVPRQRLHPADRSAVTFFGALRDTIKADPLALQAVRIAELDLTDTRLRSHAISALVATGNGSSRLLGDLRSGTDPISSPDLMSLAHALLPMLGLNLTVATPNTDGQRISISPPGLDSAPWVTLIWTSGRFGATRPLSSSAGNGHGVDAEPRPAATALPEEADRLVAEAENLTGSFSSALHAARARLNRLGESDGRYPFLLQAIEKQFRRLLATRVTPWHNAMLREMRASVWQRHTEIARLRPRARPSTEVLPAYQP